MILQDLCIYIHFIHEYMLSQKFINKLQFSKYLQMISQKLNNSQNYQSFSVSRINIFKPSHFAKLFLKITLFKLADIKSFQQNTTYNYILKKIKRKMKTIIMILLVAICSAQIFQNIGCAQFSNDGQCTACMNRYYLNKDSGICFPVNPFCYTYNITTGLCTGCYSNFILTEAGTCISQRSLPAIIQNCGIYKIDGSCMQCKDGYLRSAGNQCVAKKIGCARYNEETVECIECINGYEMIDDECRQILIENCLVQVGGRCDICKSGYFKQNGVCFPVIEKIDQNCESYVYGICEQCNEEYILTDEKQCIKSSPLCSKYSKSGQCEVCEPGFVLISGFCVIQQDEEQIIFDPFCSIFKEKICVKCSWGYYFNQNKRCTMANPLCQTYDQNNGSCLTCYNGFRISEGLCVQYHEELDPNCHRFQGNKCVKCSQGAYFGAQGKCIFKDVYCKQINQNGQCTACYPGYIRNSEKKCIVNQNFNCFEWKDQICLKCSRGYFLGLQGNCELINPLCKTFDHAIKSCVQCYPGYVLKDGQCIQLTKFVGELPYDINCSQMDLSGNCLKCFKRYFLKNGTCHEVSAYCRTYEPKRGYCLTCYKGYKIDYYGACVLDI